LSPTSCDPNSIANPVVLDANDVRSRAREFAALLVDCVAGGTSIGFVLPFGEIEVSSIPSYAAYPDGRLAPTTVFYKQLT
jgi:hypothetical protein